MNVGPEASDLDCGPGRALRTGFLTTGPGWHRDRSGRRGFPILGYRLRELIVMSSREFEVVVSMEPVATVRVRVAMVLVRGSVRSNVDVTGDRACVLVGQKPYARKE